MRSLIFGCGYLGSRVAKLWGNVGEDVTVVTRSAEKAQQFQSQGYGAVVADITRLESLAKLPVCGKVLFSVGFDRKKCAEQIVSDVYANGMKNVLEVLTQKSNTQAEFIYISTTGVYPNTNGGWVDEKTVPAPTRDGAMASFAAENALLKSCFAAKAKILRLAGIYGPGRVPFIEAVRSNMPIPASPEGWLNLIHVEDAANIVANAMELPKGLYNVTDGTPVLRKDYYNEIAKLLNAESPQYITPSENTPKALRAKMNRRVSSEFLMKTRPETLIYSSFRAGLQAIICSK